MSAIEGNMLDFQDENVFIDLFKDIDIEGFEVEVDYCMREDSRVYRLGYKKIIRARVRKENWY